MKNKVIGLCSKCNGLVVEEEGRQPYCKACGAVIKTTLPVIEMTESAKSLLLS